MKRLQNHIIDSIVISLIFAACWFLFCNDQPWQPLCQILSAGIVVRLVAFCMLPYPKKGLK